MKLTSTQAAPDLRKPRTRQRFLGSHQPVTIDPKETEMTSTDETKTDAHAAGYADAVARLRDDERYTNWWMSSDAKPDGRIRHHLADYLETVGPDGVDVTTGHRPAREQAAAVVAADRQRIAAWLLRLVGEPSALRGWKARHDLDSQYVGMALRAVAADLTSGEPIPGLDDDESAAVSR